MSGNDTSTQNVQQVSQPWSAAQPYLQDIMSQAQGLYNQGSSYAPFSTVAPFSPETEMGLQLTADRAVNGSPTIDSANGLLQRLMGGGYQNNGNGQPAYAATRDVGGAGPTMLPQAQGMWQDGDGNWIQPPTAQQQAQNTQPGGQMPPSGLVPSQTSPGSDALTGLLRGYQDPGNNLAQQAAGAVNPATGLAQQQATANPNANPATQYLGSQATDASINPYLKSMFDAAASPVTDAVNAQFSMAGRTGSTANQQTLTKNLGDLAANIYGTNYNQARALQQSAAGQIQGAYDNSQGRNLQATGLLGQLGQNQASNLLQAGGQLSQNAGNQAQTIGNAANSLNSQFNTGNQQALTAAGLAPTIAGQDYTDLNNLLQAGGARDTQAQTQLNDLLTRYQYGQEQPWNLLSNYTGAVNGLGALGGTTSGTTTAKTPNSSTPSLIGGGASLLGSLLQSGAFKGLFG